MNRATLDVNILVASAISPRGVSRRLVRAWLAGPFVHVTSEHIIEQVILKLGLERIARRYELLPEEIATAERTLREIATVVAVPASQIIPVTGDPEDGAVLAAARLGGPAISSRTTPGCSPSRRLRASASSRPAPSGTCCRSSPCQPRPIQCR